MNNNTNKTDNQNNSISAKDQARENWLKIREQLNDKKFAFEFYRQKLQKAKDNIGDILSVTSGNMIVSEPNSEHGHAVLMEILEMFMIRHENFDRAQLAEDLQEHIFHWSMDYTGGRSNWNNKIFASIGLDSYGEPLEKAASDGGQENDAHRAMIAGKLANMKRGDNQFEVAQICATSQTQAADLLNVSHRAVQSAVADWLYNARTNDAPEIAELIEKLISVISFDGNPILSPQDFYDYFIRLDERIKNDRDDKTALEAADILGDIAARIKDFEILKDFIGIYSFWLNPEGGDIDYSEVKGKLLAETVVDIVHNRNVPPSVREAMLSAMTSLHESMPEDVQDKLSAIDEDKNIEYTDALFRAANISRRTEPATGDGDRPTNLNAFAGGEPLTVSDIPHSKGRTKPPTIKRKPAKQTTKPNATGKGAKTK